MKAPAGFESLRRRILRKKFQIAVVGLGYVGLPLAIEFAKKGVSVLGIEVDRDRVERIRKKISYITDVPTAQLRAVLARGTFRAAGNFDALPQADVVIICVPTPLKRKTHPDISYIVGAVKQIRRHLRPGQLVILESTTYPGTTEEVILPLLETRGMKCGVDFYLAFSPERIDPGNARFPVNKIPKVMGGITPEATELSSLVYRCIVEKTVPVSSARVAETVKLLENTFRIVNIGLIDELAMMAHKMKIDIWEIIEAAKTKPFGFMPFYPGPGVGGHCIPKDPLYLYWKARKFGFQSRFIKLASQVITRMPEYVVERVREILLAQGIPLKGAQVLVAGVTYKKDIKDLRKSPPLDVIESLRQKGARVSYFDPLIPYLHLNEIRLESIAPDARALARFDCVVIATDHTKVDYAHILKNSRRVLDTRNVYKGIASPKINRL